LRVFGTGSGVVDRARADHQQETFVVGENQAANFFARMGDKRGLRFGLGLLGHELRGRGQDTGFNDVDVGRFLHGRETLADSRFVWQASSRRDVQIQKRSWPVAYP